MLLSKTLRLFLDSIGRRDEYEFYLEKFQSDDSACFALVCPELTTVHELLAFDLDFLHRLELHPLTVLCGPEAEAMLQALKATGHTVHDCRLTEQGIEALVDSIRGLSEEGIRVLVDPERSFEQLLPLLIPAVAGRVHFLRASGALKDPSGQMIPFINPGFDVAAGVFEEDRAKAELCLALLEQLPSAHFSVSSSLDLLKEMFTVKGAGTVFRPGSRLRLLKDKEAIDFDRLQALIENSFNKTLVAGSSVREASTLIVEEQYRGAALLERQEAGNYLSKFAVGTEARGEGLALEIWQEVLSQAPALFWRSRADNPVNQWYARQADGMQRVGDWQVFWRGVALDQIAAVIQYCVDRPADFIEADASAEPSR